MNQILGPTPCSKHCYCKDVQIGGKPHKECCMCGHRHLASYQQYMITISPPVIIPYNHTTW